MADPNKIAKIKEGVKEWNKSRIDNPNDVIDLSGADLSNLDLSGANFYGADLTDANLRGAKLYLTTLEHATLTRADLTGADLGCAHMVDTNIEEAIFTGCKVYGLSAWDLTGKPTDQTGLIVTSQYKPDSPEWDEPQPVPETVITVDDLQTAQFIHLLLKNENVRNIINAVTSKAVLILGRFTPERKKILNAVATELRKNNLLPIIFDFERPSSKDFTETIKTLAGMSLFIIADITDPSSVPLELQATVPDYKIPFVPIIEAGKTHFAMLSDLTGKYNWVLEPLRYPSLEMLIAAFKPAVIDRAWNKHQVLQKQKTGEVETLSVEDFLNN